MLSVSMLSGYLYCPRKVYLQYALKLKEPPKPCLVLGSLRHRVFECLNNTEEEIVTGISESLSFESLLALYREKYRSILYRTVKENRSMTGQFEIPEDEVIRGMESSVAAEAEERAKNVAAFMEKTGLTGVELWDRLTPKMISEFNIESSSLGIRGIVDRIEVHDSHIVPVELKTGKCPSEGAWPSHRLQLTAYMLMLGEKEREVSSGRIVYLDSGRAVNVPKNPFNEMEVKSVARRTREILASRKPPCFCRNSRKCDTCGLKSQCHDEAFIKSRINEVFGGSEQGIPQKQKI